ncbi:MAG: restriction endonuclease subunit S [Verrucomicrobia bacterium]|nr:restriction endonuclease subunit S [Verrucomicrobiota bacterium]
MKTTATKEAGSPTLVPKLRFPDFRGAGEWETKPLGKVAENLDNKRRPITSSDRAAGDVPYYGASGIVDYVEGYIFDEDLLCVSEDGANLVARTYPIAFPISGKTWVNNHAHVLRFENGCTQKFVEVYLNSIKLDDFITGMAQPKLNKAMLDRIPIPHTCVPEQQEIAECLSSVDELMAAQARKVDALKTHKKGLMQQLFPREGETQPRLRFPEFQNAEEWEEVALGDIAEIKLGKMLDKQKHTTGRLLPYLNNVSVRWNEVNTSNLPQMFFNDSELDRFGLRAGDVVVCEGGEPGRAAVWDGRLPDLKFQKAIHRVRFNVPFEPRLLVLHLENLAGTTQFEMLFTGGGIKHFTRETFAQLKIPLIPHAEQQRIATCLSSLDALITAETRKLEALKTHKKGLMQQLFPSPEANEG